jgi:formylglycine-generating enzyme required for sulfatase activity
MAAQPIRNSSTGTDFPKPEFALIPEGWFWMGDEAGQDNERPLHRVWVDAFRLAVCQVTNAEYARFLNATSSLPPPFWSDPNFDNSRQPVVAVSWFDAVKYCDWRSGSEDPGCRFRLPTEAEWERAARGGVEGLLYPWGNSSPQSLPDYAKRWKKGPEPVAAYAPNRFGLYDISENVHEWCNDWYQPDYYAISPERNPRGPETGTRRVSRGGSWRHHVKVSRCGARSSIPPEFQYADYGFRIACEV